MITYGGLFIYNKGKAFPSNINVCTMLFQRTILLVLEVQRLLYAVPSLLPRTLYSINKTIQTF